MKYLAIYRKRKKYPIQTMCQFFGVSHSGYYDYIKRMDKPDRDEALTAEVARYQEHSRRTYGYRRVQLWLEQQGIHRNPKTVLRIMRKYGLLSEIRRRKKYRVMEQQLHRYENLLNRDCTAQRPNQKWVTEISYIHTAQGVLYLSVIRDLFEQHCRLQIPNRSVHAPCTRHHSRCYAKREGRCGVAAPQRPRLSIYLSCIFQPD